MYQRWANNSVFEYSQIVRTEYIQKTNYLVHFKNWMMFIFVFGFYFWTKYICIRWSKYYLLTSVTSLQERLVTLNIEIFQARFLNIVCTVSDFQHAKLSWSYHNGINSFGNISRTSNGKWWKWCGAKQLCNTTFQKSSWALFSVLAFSRWVHPRLWLTLLLKFSILGPSGGSGDGRTSNWPFRDVSLKMDRSHWKGNLNWEDLTLHF